MNQMEMKLKSQIVRSGEEMRKVRKNGMKNGVRCIDRIRNKSGVINGKLIYQLGKKKEKVGDRITVKIIKLKNIGQRNGMIDIRKMEVYTKRGIKYSNDNFFQNIKI